jgi:hypothetical protein
MTPRRNGSLLPSLLLLGVTLAGCHAGGAGQQPAPTAATTPLTQAPQPTSGSRTPAGGCDQLLGSSPSPEGPGSQRFELTRQQLAVIGSHLIEVLCDQGLWQQGVGFGFNYEKDPNRVFVLISPGRSGLTAKQVLDRLLGRG